MFLTFTEINHVLVQKTINSRKCKQCFLTAKQEYLKLTTKLNTKIYPIRNWDFYVSDFKGEINIKITSYRKIKDNMSSYKTKIRGVPQLVFRGHSTDLTVLIRK